jgi:cell division protein FtsZ
MENEVKITLITTGFHAKLGMGKVNAEEEELNKILKNMKTEEELDMPSFLRRPLFSHRKLPTTQTETKNEPVKPRYFE